MKSEWVVAVDIAPRAVAERVSRALRDLGFAEALPCVFVTSFGPLDQAKLKATVMRARRGGLGRILACPVGKLGVQRW